MCCLLVFILFVGTTVYVQYQCPSILSLNAPLAEEKQEEYKELSVKKDFKDTPMVQFSNFIQEVGKLKKRPQQHNYLFKFTLDIFRPPQFV